MAELWNAITLPQSLVVLAGLWLAVQVGGALVDLVRRRKGLPPLEALEHCEHCEIVNSLDEPLDKLVALASDSYNLLDDVQKSTWRIAEAAESDRLQAEVVAMRRALQAMAARP